jgi:hypothetical protein
LVVEKFGHALRGQGTETKAQSGEEDGWIFHKQ